MSNPTWLTEWRHRRMLKKLGPLEPQHVEQSERYMQRKHEADAMPGLILMPRPVIFRASRWIMGHRELPVVQGRLRGGVK